jgi:WhiB family redox-sensing transcriptional regulator
VTSCPLCGVVLRSRASMGGHFTNAHPKASRHAEGPCEYARRDCSCSHCAEFNKIRSRARRAPYTPAIRIVQPRPGWFDEAACKGEDPTLWHPDGTDNQRAAAKAIAICKRCPVRQDCLEHALANDEWLGVWGGTQPSERHRIAARRAGRQA